ncbi:hypothetical protein ACSLNK_29405, partial [Escherichia coli]
ILADVMATWSTTWFSGGISALAWAIAMVIMINVMLWTNSNAGMDMATKCSQRAFTSDGSITTINTD